MNRRETDRMKLLILSNIDMGLYKFRKELLEEFVKSYEVFFCVPSGGFVEKICDLGCKYIPCNVLARRSTNPIKDCRLYKFYKEVLNKIKPDIVLTYTIKPNVYGGIACSLKKIPYISNITGLGTSIENGGVLAFISTTLYKLGLKRAQCVFFQNKDNQNLFFHKKIVKGRSCLIPGSGVNLNTHYYEPYPKNTNIIHFLFVGRIMKDKGIEELVTVMKDIHETRKDVVLDIVGFCDENYNDLLKKAEKDGVIINHGIQMDVHPYYKNCHCVVLPSYHEGMANVLLEASSTGRPVITTRVPGCRETYEEGITGLGCEARSIISLKEAILVFISLSNERREEMGKAAREKMVREYDRNKVVKAYMNELNNLSFATSNRENP